MPTIIAKALTKAAGLFFYEIFTQVHHPGNRLIATGEQASKFPNDKVVQTRVKVEPTYIIGLYTDIRSLWNRPIQLLQVPKSLMVGGGESAVTVESISTRTHIFC